MTQTIRIGSGLGFYGDSWDPVVASVERGGVHYSASDHLAELTLAILAKDRQKWSPPPCTMPCKAAARAT